MTSLGEITAALLLYAQASLGGVSASLQAPQIAIMPRAEMNQNICRGHSCKATGFYSEVDGKIYLDDSLDVVNNLYHRSILLHELVHYVQHQRAPRGRVHPRNLCQAKRDAEAEAYYVQGRWLRQQGVKTGRRFAPPVLYTFLRMRMQHCERMRLTAQHDEARRTH